MSLMYCAKCNKNIDTDFDVEHFEKHNDAMKLIDKQRIEEAKNYCDITFCICKHNLTEHNKPVHYKRNIGCDNCDCGRFIEVSK